MKHEDIATLKLKMVHTEDMFNRNGSLNSNSSERRNLINYNAEEFHMDSAIKNNEVTCNHGRFEFYDLVII